jgi:hypothetical protein
MRFILPLAVSFSLFAFGAQAADEAKKAQSDSKPAMSQGASSSSGSASSGSASTGASGGAKAQSKGAASSAFDRADTNKDGQLSKEEFAAMQKRRSGASSGKTSSSKSPSSGMSPSSKPAK